MKYIKIFSRNHLLLDEIDDFSGLKYGWVLNSKGSAEFSMPLESERCTEMNFTFRNHVEIWDNGFCLWGGEIVSLQFSSSKLKVGCYGYMSLLERRRLRAASYSEMTYGALFTQLLADVNTIEATGVAIGNVDSGSLKTQRTVNAEDMLLEKLQDLSQDGNYDFDVDENRKLNFYLKKGSDKRLDHILEFGGDADNIILAPTLTRNAISLANSVFSQADGGLSTTKEDSTSRALYGYQETVLSGNDSIINQSTLDNNTTGELQRRAYPTSNLNITAIDSPQCAFNDLEVGGIVTVNLIPYWNYSEALRILEMTHDEDSGQREIVVGDSIYRQQPPIIRIYKK